MQKFPSEGRPQNRLTEPPESFGTLLGELAGQSADLVRDEITLAKQELSEKLSFYYLPLLFLLGGSLAGVLSVLILCSALIIWLGERIGFGLAATLIGSGLALVAAIILIIGRVQLSNLSLKPEVTIKTLEENTEWLKDMN
jgi:hypothetical protein